MTEEMTSIKKLVEAGDKLPDAITFKNVVILITWIIKDGDKCYQQLFLEEALVVYKLVESWSCWWILVKSQ